MMSTKFSPLDANSEGCGGRLGYLVVDIALYISISLQSQRAIREGSVAMRVLGKCVMGLVVVHQDQSQ
jgi:hypothetical protein